MIDLQLRIFFLSAPTLEMRVSGGPDAWFAIEGNS